MIVLRSAEEIEKIRKAGAIIAKTFDELRKAVRPGLPTKEMDTLARKVIIEMGGYPAFKGYKGYPSNICVSVNEEVVHGIPSDRRLSEGDIVSIDIGVRFRDYYADAAITLGVDKISEDRKTLINATEKALYKGIEEAFPGNRISDVSAGIQEYVESMGFSVVRALVGHGIGSKIHEEPEVPNYGTRGTGPRIDPGMVIAIEPMVNAGTYEVEVLDDGWTVVTKDRKPSAHFEHTIVVTKDGSEILTTL